MRKIDSTNLWIQIYLTRQYLAVHAKPLWVCHASISVVETCKLVVFLRRRAITQKVTGKYMGDTTKAQATPANMTKVEKSRRKARVPPQELWVEQPCAL